MTLNIFSKLGNFLPQEDIEEVKNVIGRYERLEDDFYVFINKEDLTLLVLVEIPQDITRENDLFYENNIFKANFIYTENNFDDDDYYIGFLLFEDIIELREDEPIDNIFKEFYLKLKEKNLYKINIRFVKEISYDFDINNLKNLILNWIRSFIFNFSIDRKIKIFLYKNKYEEVVFNFESLALNKLKIYDEISLVFLENANKTEFNHIKFLELYHILERFMVEEERKKWDSLLRKLAESYLKGEFDSRLQALKKEIKSISLRENDLLKLVIKTIPKENLHSIYDSLDQNVKEQLKKTPCFLEDLNNKVVIKSKEEFEKNISNRIYAIRNSIVHSKTTEGEKIFNSDRIDHQQELLSELKVLYRIVIEFLNEKYKDNLITRYIKFL